MYLVEVVQFAKYVVCAFFVVEELIDLPRAERVKTKLIRSPIDDSFYQYPTYAPLF